MTRANPPRSAEELPYRIELWRTDKHDEVEKVLARAVSAQLARAIFQTAMEEHPQRRITLCKGKQILSDSVC